MGDGGTHVGAVVQHTELVQDEALVAVRQLRHPRVYFEATAPPRLLRRLHVCLCVRWTLCVCVWLWLYSVAVCYALAAAAPWR